jgi:hypothetical protein
MKETFSARKAAVLVGAVLLVSAFVCYNAGAFSFLTRAQPDPTPQAVNKTSGEPTEQAPTANTTPQAKAPAHFLGSKSAVPAVGVVIPGNTPQAPPSPNQQAPKPQAPNPNGL